MQHCHHDLKCRDLLFGMWLDRDAPSIVLDRDRAIVGDNDYDAVADAGHRLVNTVIDDLGHELVQAADVSAAYIHTGALAHRLESFEDLYLGGGIGILLHQRLRGCHTSTLPSHSVSSKPTCTGGRFAEIHRNSKGCLRRATTPKNTLDQAWRKGPA